MPFAAMLTANNIALPNYSLEVTGNAFHYLGHAHLLIDGKGYKLVLKSNRNHLTNHMKSKSRHKLFIASGVDTQTHTQTCQCPTQK